ncbi:MAG: hypothetical protein LBV02_02265 [Bacteroidales bacterium]|jgi:hypothetical protein|nr:hypothetical protein [Bacteroidales bacterium]
MKKVLLLFVLSSGVFVMTAQSTSKKVVPDPMLYEIRSESKIAEYLEMAPDKILDLNSYVQNFCYVSNEKPADGKVLGDISDVKSPGCNVDASNIIVKKRINPGLFSFRQDEGQYNVYTIGSTGWYVIVYPIEIYTQKREEYMNQYKK